MRNCQICGHSGKRVILNNYDNQNMCLFECTECGHRYIDGLHLSQAWFDNYYLTAYTTDDKPYSDARLNSLAECIAVYDLETVIDIGGMDGELTHIIADKRAARVTGISGVGDTVNFQYNGVILSHTLEHIYDIGVMFDRIKATLLHGVGHLFVEVPLHIGNAQPIRYDYHWQHINKFREQDLAALFNRHGFEVLENKRIDDYREYYVQRIVGRYA